MIEEYHGKFASLFLGDAVEILRTLTEKVDALVMDPPYCSGGISEAGKGRSTGQGLRSATLAHRLSWFEGDNMTTGGLCDLLRRVCVYAPLRDTSSVISFTDWRMIPMVIPAMEGAGLIYRGLVTWDKGSIGLGNGFRPRAEYAIHLTGRRPKYGTKSGANVIEFPRTRLTMIHPTAKPIEVVSKLVEVGSIDSVCDPFMGGGTTGIAAIRLGRRFVGIERDPKYFAEAVKRIQFEEDRRVARGA